VNNERFLGIHKFFELNQAPGWMEEDLKNLKILKVQEKIDGTLLQPILIDNKIYFKSKLRFDSFEAKRANEILNSSENLKKFIFNCYKNNKIPLFEYISQKSQVVMDYKKEALILIQVRDLKSGEYDLEFEKEAKKFSIECAQVCESKNLQDYLTQKKNCTSKEGWVIIFEGMHFVKVKTDEYLKRHSLIAKVEPHHIIQKALENRIDEYFQILNKNSQKYSYVKETLSKFNYKYNLLKKDIKKSFKLNKSELKKEFLNHPYYEVIALCHKQKSLAPLNNWLKEHTKKLKGAKKFLD
jgi:RNA ligase